MLKISSSFIFLSVCSVIILLILLCIDLPKTNILYSNNSIAQPAADIMPISTGGSSWVWETPYPTGNNVTSVSCPDDNICYIAGQGGMVLKTLDKGQTWLALETGIATSLNIINCPDALTCVAAGNSIIHITTDGGTNWTTLTTPSRLTSLTCPTTNLCYGIERMYDYYQTIRYVNNTWVVSGLLRNSNLANLSAISCPASQICYALGSYNPTLYSTTNGGATWSISFANNPEIDTLGELICPTTVLCFAAGNQGRLVKIVDNANVLEWKILVSNTGQNFRSLSCPSVTFCVAFSDANEFRVTKDGGLNWVSQTASAAGGTAVNCAGENSCLLVGSGGLIQSGPAPSWISLNTARYNSLKTITCPTVSDCIVIGNNVILTTEDAGRNWLPVTSTIPTTLLNSISCYNAASCYIVGTAGSILQMTKIAGVWSIATKVSNTNQNLNAISCPSTYTCIATGDNGVILRLANDSSWAISPSNVSTSLKGISCHHLGVCFVVGDNGTFLTTNNNGVSWNSGSVGIPWDLKAISCPEINVCYVITETQVFRTINAGKNWDKKILPLGVSTNNTLNCPSTDNCYLSVYRTKTREGK